MPPRPTDRNASHAPAIPELHDKVVLIAGGAGEVGEGLVRAFLAEGPTVVVPSRSDDKLDALRERLEADDRLVSWTGDVGSEAGSAALRDWGADTAGPLDAVVASLGSWWQGAPLTEVPLDTWHRLIDMGLTAHFVMAKTFVPVLAGRSGASYTLISGAGALHPVPGSGPISVSAAAQLLLKDVLAAESETVRINTLLLATPVITRPCPDGPDDWLTADDAGAHAVHLASDAARGQHGATVVLASCDQLPAQRAL
ncbi:SDR family NAD(P)-dependent oxidoreductase [Salisaeta longa]|uniref:SDR family NAD(P)-dependent oxidoreductase n=1 Tax=Salisaeta longa TaxID=503170 RepID=UPI0003B5F08D|nr:SDR family oxidoreductase [Salisaeta longa]